MSGVKIKKSVAGIMCLAALTMVFSGFFVSAHDRTVVDEADLLTPAQEMEIAEQLERFSEKYGVDAAAVTVENTGGQPIAVYADDYYDNNGYGVGSAHSGFMLMISESSREYYITTYGSSIDVLDRSAVSHIGDNIVKNLKNNDYYGGLKSFAETADEIYAEYKAGDAYNDADHTKYFIAIGAAAVLAAAVTGLLLYNMNDAIKNNSASMYVKDGSINMIKEKDTFLYSTVSKVKKQQSNSTTHRSSSGRVHGGGGGSF